MESVLSINQLNNDGSNEQIDISVHDESPNNYQNNTIGIALNGDKTEVYLELTHYESTLLASVLMVFVEKKKVKE